MEKFIPYQKLSKKEKRKIDQARRRTWGELSPVTRKPESSNAYKRRKSQNWTRELPPTACDFSILTMMFACYELPELSQLTSVTF